MASWPYGFLAIAVIVGGVYLTCRWYDRLPYTTIVVRDTEDGLITENRRLNTFVGRVSAWRPGWDGTTAMLAGALLLLAWSGVGGWIYPKVFCRAGRFDSDSRPKGEVRQLTMPDGTLLNVEAIGPVDGPRIILTHGWGCDCQMWLYAVNQLAGHYRVVLWDLPGLGLSTTPANRDYSIAKMANDVRAVLEATGKQPAILVGHSIGGMITLTLCKLFPALLSGPVVGISIVQSTYTNPLRTTRFASLLTSMQRPFIEPLLAMTVYLSPLVWLMNCLSYLNGSAHRSTAKESFAGNETRGQLNFAARYTLKASPAVIARGTLGMLHYDVTAALSQIDIPTQIVVGDQDVTTLPAAGRHMDHQIRESNLLSLAPAKHLGFFEQHNRFNNELSRFALNASHAPTASPCVSSHFLRGSCGAFNCGHETVEQMKV